MANEPNQQPEPAVTAAADEARAKASAEAREIAQDSAEIVSATDGPAGRTDAASAAQASDSAKIEDGKISPAEKKRRKVESEKLREQAEGIAEAVLGSPVGASLVSADVAREMLVDGTRSLLDLLEKLGSTASEYRYTDDDEGDASLEDGLEMVDGLSDDDKNDSEPESTEKPVLVYVHELVDAFTIRKAQRRAITDLLAIATAHAAKRLDEQRAAGAIRSPLTGSSIATKIVNGSLDLVRIVRALEETNGDSALFAQLYVPKGYRYSKKRAANPGYIKRFDEMEFGQQVGALYRFFSSSVSWSPVGIRTLLKKLISRD